MTIFLSQKKTLPGNERSRIRYYRISKVTIYVLILYDSGTYLFLVLRPIVPNDCDVYSYIFKRTCFIMFILCFLLKLRILITNMTAEGLFDSK